MSQVLPEPTQRIDRKLLLDALGFAFLFAVTLFLYRTDAGLGFLNLDDQVYVVDNPYIREASVSNLARILSKPYNANFAPAHLLSYLADYQVRGLDPKIFHLSSNLWAALVSGFVYLLGVALTRNRLVGFFAGLLFAVHPAHVEAVAWISSRKDLIAAAFAIPSMLAYFQSRRAPGHARVWYGISLALFACAIAGKLSVVVLPGLLFLSDIFLDKRKLGAAVLDKIPFALIAVLFSLLNFGAQPETRTATDLFRFGSAVLQNIWLLTGFADYVIYHDAPNPNGPAWRFVAICVAGVLIFLIPLALALRRAPVTGVLMLWTLVSFIPSQVLGFLHPVADRYLFFPSAAFCILAAWLVMKLFGQFGKIGAAAGVATLAMLSVNWSIASLKYLDEWNDPRSVWYAASHKSHDASIHLYLGNHYEDSATLLQQGMPADAATRESLRALALALWTRSPRFIALDEEWKDPGRGVTATVDLRNTLLDSAWNEYELAAQSQGGILQPNLYFRRGKIQLDRGRLAPARAEFERSQREAQAHSSVDVRHELAVRCAFALGVVAWREANYPEAMKWIKRAEEEQFQYGGRWIPDVAQQKEKLAALMARGASSAPAL